MCAEETTRGAFVTVGTAVVFLLMVALLCRAATKQTPDNRRTTLDAPGGSGIARGILRRRDFGGDGAGVRVGGMRRGYSRVADADLDPADSINDTDIDSPGIELGTR